MAESGRDIIGTQENSSSTLLGRIAYRVIDRLGFNRVTGLLGWIRTFEFLEELLDDWGSTSRSSIDALLPFKIPDSIEKPLLRIGRTAPIIKLLAGTLFLFHELAKIGTDKIWQAKFKSASFFGKCGALTELFLSATLFAIAIATFCFTGVLANAILDIIDGSIGLRDSFVEHREANRRTDILLQMKSHDGALHSEAKLLRVVGEKQLKKALRKNILIPCNENHYFKVKNSNDFEALLNKRIQRMSEYKKQAFINGSLSLIAFATGVLSIAMPTIVKVIAAVTYLIGLTYLGILGAAALYTGCIYGIQRMHAYFDLAKDDNDQGDRKDELKSAPVHSKRPVQDSRQDEPHGKLGLNTMQKKNANAPKHYGLRRTASFNDLDISRVSKTGFFARTHHTTKQNSTNCEPSLTKRFASFSL